MVRLSVVIFLIVFNTGFFQYSVCLAGSDMLCNPSVDFGNKGKQGLLQQVLRKRAAFQSHRGKTGAVGKEGYAGLA